MTQGELFPAPEPPPNPWTCPECLRLKDPDAERCVKCQMARRVVKAVRDFEERRKP